MIAKKDAAYFLALWTVNTAKTSAVMRRVGRQAHALEHFFGMCRIAFIYGDLLSIPSG
jgi:hypothetical protein